MFTGSQGRMSSLHWGHCMGAVGAAQRGLQGLESLHLRTGSGICAVVVAVK